MRSATNVAMVAQGAIRKGSKEHPKTIKRIKGTTAPATFRPRQGRM